MPGPLLIRSFQIKVFNSVVKYQSRNFLKSSQLSHLENVTKRQGMYTPFFTLGAIHDLGFSQKSRVYKQTDVITVKHSKTSDIDGVTYLLSLT